MSSKKTIPYYTCVEDLSVTPDEKEATYKSLNYFTEFSTLGEERANIPKCELKCDMPSPENDTNTIDTKADKTEIDPLPLIDQGTKTSPQVLMHRSMETKTNPDLDVVIGEVHFNCHMTLLQTYSSYFRNIDQRSTTRIELDERDISSKSFSMVYDWILDDFSDLRPSDLPYLFQGACFLGIDKLVKQCWRYLDDDLCVREFESIRMYMDGFRCFASNALRELFFSRVCKYFLPLVASEVFLSLDFIEVCVLLSSSAIGVNAESEVLMAALRWITHDPERKVFTEQLMSCIRFELMPKTFLALLSLCRYCPTVKEATDIEKVHRRILKAFDFANYMQGCYMTVDNFHQFEEDNLKLPRQRQWLIDPKCPYHHVLSCSCVEKLTFADFEKYLETLKNCCPEYWQNFQFTTLHVDRPCSNRRCVSVDTFLRQWNYNRQNSVYYIRFRYGKPTLKVPNDIQNFINKERSPPVAGKPSGQKLSMVEDVDDTEADNMNTITIQMNDIELQTHDVAGQAVSAEIDKSDDEILDKAHKAN